MAHRTKSTRLLFVGLLVGGTSLLLVGGAVSASAATVIDGPVNLGTAATYGVLAASTVTNTGPTSVRGDVGLSPGSSVTGFGGAPDGVITGTLHQTDASAAKAQADTTTAYNTAAGLTPTTSGISELAGLSLTPGVYSGGALALSDNGALTLAGSAKSVWVFQAASTLTIGSATHIVITGGASACNVFWQVGSSATLGSAARFQGTVLAQQSVTATTSATVVGRLLARTGAVTLDTNTILAPAGCPPAGTPSTTVAPTITSGTPTTATVGTPYSFTVTTTGSPSPTYTVTTGALPNGLTLNATTGAIAGTPTATGSSTFTITASNGTGPNASATYTITSRQPSSTPPQGGGGATTPGGTSGTVTPVGATGSSELAFTGSNTAGAPFVAAGLLVAGSAALAISTIRRRRRLVRR